MRPQLLPSVGSPPCLWDYFSSLYLSVSESVGDPRPDVFHVILGKGPRCPKGRGTFVFCTRPSAAGSRPPLLCPRPRPWTSSNPTRAQATVGLRGPSPEPRVLSRPDLCLLPVAGGGVALGASPHGQRSGWPHAESLARVLVLAPPSRRARAGGPSEEGTHPSKSPVILTLATCAMGRGRRGSFNPCTLVCRLPTDAILLIGNLRVRE